MGTSFNPEGMNEHVLYLCQCISEFERGEPSKNLRQRAMVTFFYAERNTRYLGAGVPPQLKNAGDVLVRRKLYCDLIFLCSAVCVGDNANVQLFSSRGSDGLDEMEWSAKVSVARRSIPSYLFAC